MTVCVQCCLRALLAQEPVPSFEGSFEAHEADVHRYPDASNYQFRQLIEAVWTLDEAGWREVDRRLREQGERPDVAHEDARSLGVLRDFLVSGRRRRAAEAGAGVPLPIFPSGAECAGQLGLPLTSRSGGRGGGRRRKVRRCR